MSPSVMEKHKNDQPPKHVFLIHLDFGYKINTLKTLFIVTFPNFGHVCVERKRTDM